MLELVPTVLPYFIVCHCNISHSFPSEVSLLSLFLFHRTNKRSVTISLYHHKMAPRQPAATTAATRKQRAPKTWNDHIAIAGTMLAVMFLIQWLVYPFGVSQIRRAKDLDPKRLPDVIHYADGTSTTLNELLKIIEKDNEDNEPIDISLIIPAYNEEIRLPIMLRKTIPFLEKWCEEDKLKYEIIVVDDGSRDATVNVVLTQAQELSSKEDLKVLKLAENRGKGGAVKQGVKAARGNYILMVDGDGATDITALPRLYRELRRIEVINSAISGNTEPLGIAIGSRAHLEEKSVSTRAFYRTVLMRGFHLLVMLLCTQNVRDTQCGFKLFTKQTAKMLFDILHLEGWAFDIELIFVGEQLGIPMREVAVSWEEVDGSKLIQSKADVIITSLTMARDMLTVRLAYLFGLWKMI